MLEYVTNIPSLSLVVFSLLVLYGIKSWLSHPANLPPMPCLPLPVFGHALYLRPTLLHAMSRWRKELGDIFTIYVHRKPVIVLASPERLSEALVKQADNFSNRPLTVRHTLISQDGTHGISSSSNTPWKEQRTVTVSILRSFGMGKNIMAQRIAVEVDKYLEALAGLDGQARQVGVLTNSAVANVICALVVDERFEYGDPFLESLLQLNDDIMMYVAPDSILNTLPWLRFLPGDLFGAQKLHRAYADVKVLFSDRFIKKAKLDPDKDNFIAAYLKEMKGRAVINKDTAISEANLRWIVLDLFVGGTETTSTTLLWAILFSMHFPETQEKIYQEIQEALGTDRVPGIKDRTKLNYLNAFIMETQRFGSIAPLSLLHTCSRTCTVAGYTLPQGCTVIPFLDAVLKDPAQWPEPDKFKPERFLDENNKLVIPLNFMPFSVGRRICMGESLARMELFLFLSAMFQTFQIRPETPNCLPPLDGHLGVTFGPKPFSVRFIQRQR